MLSLLVIWLLPSGVKAKVKIIGRAMLALIRDFGVLVFLFVGWLFIVSLAHCLPWGKLGGAAVGVARLLPSGASYFLCLGICCLLVVCDIFCGLLFVCGGGLGE